MIVKRPATHNINYLKNNLTNRNNQVMRTNNNDPNWITRNRLAIGILILAGIALAALVVTAICVNPQNAMNIVNIILPVISSWVGTILAFYFSNENFEAANQQVRESNKQMRELVQQFTPEERASLPVSSIMRLFTDTVYFQFTQLKSDQNIQLTEILKIFQEKGISRLLIIDESNLAKYMIHQSSINKYIVSMYGNKEDTLAQFITNQQKSGFEFGLNEGFIVVSEATTIAIAKRNMEKIRDCQDILITKGGSPSEPVTGWISNVRMLDFLKV